MSTISNVKHLIANDCFKIKTKIKVLQAETEEYSYTIDKIQAFIAHTDLNDKYHANTHAFK